MLQDSLTKVAFVSWVIEPGIKLLIDSNSCVLCERLSENVFRFNVRNKTLIAWNILGLDVLSWPTNPVFAFLRGVGELETESLEVLWCLLRIKSSLSMLHGSSTSHQGALGVLRGLFRLIYDYAVGFSGGAGENLHLFGDVSSVAREILLLIIDLSCHYG